MSTRKVPMRQCTGCKEMKNKREMIRILKTPEDEIIVDKTGKKNGRGAYLCSTLDCFQKARQSKGLEKSLKVAIPKELYEQLEKEMIQLESN